MIAIHGGAGVYQNNEHKLCSKILKKSKNLIDAVMVFKNFYKKFFYLKFFFRN